MRSMIFKWLRRQAAEFRHKGYHEVVDSLHGRRVLQQGGTHVVGGFLMTQRHSTEGRML